MGTGNKNAAVDVAAAVLEKLVAELDGTMPLRTALFYLKVAQATVHDEQPDVSSIAAAMDIPSALASRDLGLLSEYSRAAEGGGLQVLEAIPDLNDRRRKRLRLTRKGARVLDVVTGAVR